MTDQSSYQSSEAGQELDALIERMAELDERAESILALRPTLPPRVDIDTDGLSAMSSRFARLAMQMAAAATHIDQQAQALHNSGWTGTAAERFCAELDGLVIPTLHHLQRSLQNWQQQTGRMSANVQQASAALESLSSRVKTIEDVKALVGSDAIERAVREQVQQARDQHDPQNPQPPQQEPATNDDQ